MHEDKRIPKLATHSAEVVVTAKYGFNGTCSGSYAVVSAPFYPDCPNRQPQLESDAITFLSRLQVIQAFLEAVDEDLWRISPQKPVERLN